MKRILTPLLQTTVCLLFTLAFVAPAPAADKKADGTWTWTTPGRQGGTPRTMTLKLKVEGEKVTGTVSTPGRDGGEARETAIADGKIKGEDISFTVTRENNNGDKFVSKYAGKLSGDSIKGKIESERGGEARSNDWEAKRSEAKDKEKEKDKDK